MQRDAEWREEQKIIAEKIKEHDNANESQMLTGIQAIELFRKATSFYFKQSPAKKKKLLKYYF